jgi:spiro-SPASM protein
MINSIGLSYGHVYVDKEMKRMVVCLFGEFDTYLSAPLAGTTSIERLQAYVSELPDVVRVVVLGRDGVSVPDEWELRVGAHWTNSQVVTELAGLVDGPDCEVLFTFLDQPFVSKELTRRMLERHRKYRADFTFADGYPKGLAPEIIAGRAVGHLQNLAAEDLRPFSREGLFGVVQKDINRLDVETELSPRDQRILRLTLAVDTRANLMVCEAMAHGAPEGIDQWQDHVEKLAPEHRTLPRYVGIQVIEQEIQKLTYSPYPQMRAEVTAPGAVMRAERFRDLVRQIAEFSPEAVLAISLWGEVSLHPECVALVETVLDTPALRLIVETSGVGWSPDSREKLLSLAGPRLLLIVGLDTDDPDGYREIRGDGYAEAVAFAEEAVKRAPESSYVQATRSEITEPTLEDFYKRWKALTERVIIQKYDHFCGVLPQRRIGDLSPVDRFPCWHAQRDLSILVDGTVPLCREDLGTDSCLGNVFEEGIDAVWRAGRDSYLRHLKGDYPSLCRECDEYYTFNY